MNVTRIYCEMKQMKSIREFLLSKGFSNELICELSKNGLTDDVVREMQCRGFSYEDMVTVCKELRRKFSDCDCSSSNESEISERRKYQYSDYLKEYFSGILPPALREISLKKPYDPVEYLGHWLLHYRDCEDRERRRKEFEAELLEERLKWQTPIVISGPDVDYEDEGESTIYE